MSIILLLLAIALALIRTGQNIVEARGFRRLVLRRLAEPPGTYAPRAAVLAPCRGPEPHLVESLRALLTQDYPDYDVIFVFDSADDPARTIVRTLLDAPDFRTTASRVETLVAGRCADRGQKVHNLSVGLRDVQPDVEALAFVDSDIIAGSDWLRHLVAPLSDETIGVTTGYRVVLPERGGLASGLLAAWNATVLSALVNPGRGFPWGGSMALRRKTFDAIGVADAWEGSVSDDFGVRRAVRAARIRIRFVPPCLVRSPADTTWADLWEFVCRQYTITRVYAPDLWRAGLLMNLVYAAGLFVAPMALWGSGPTGVLPGIGLAGSATLWGSTIALGLQRHRLSTLPFSDSAGACPTPWRSQIPAAPLLCLLNGLTLIRAGLRRRISWRGIGYRLDGPNRVTVERDG